MATTVATKQSMREILNSSEAIQFIKKTIADNSSITTQGLSEVICKKYSLIAPNGTAQTAGCYIVLKSLNEKELITLPTSSQDCSRKKYSLARLGEDVPLPPKGLMPTSAEQLSDGLEIILLGKNDKKLKLIWNELMVTEHPQGEKLLIGYQIKYLVCYKDYYIGGFAFSSSSFHLEARDKWIDWTKEEQELNRQSILCMSRFLIRNAIHCKNLASKLLSMALKRIAGDYKTRYNIDLWLVESFCDTASYKGTCYKAANWIYLGSTKGRGRNDSEHKNNVGKKDIYIYPIKKKFRKISVPKIDTSQVADKVYTYEPKNIEEGLSSEDWIRQEFGRANIKKASHKDRLFEVLEHKITSPSLSYPAVANGNRNMLDGYYRFLAGYTRFLPLKDGETEKKKTDPVIHFDDILAGHRDETISRMASYNKVLVIQDSCDLNYKNLKETKGLGLIGKNSSASAGTLGVRLHSSFTVTEEGLPLGITKSQVDSPKVYSIEERAERARLPFTEKDNYKWYLHYLDTIEVSKLIDSTQLISVMDREGDNWEIFEEAVDNKDRAPVLIRVKQDRLLSERDSDGKNIKLFHKMNTGGESFKVKMKIPEQRAREKTSRKEARPYLPPRIATLLVRYGEVEICSPVNKKDSKKKTIKLNFLYVTEKDAPPGAENISWRLLTTLKLETKEDALSCISYYKERWKIEDWHRVLKSGCKIEKHKQDDVESLKNIIAIDLVIAWRIMLLTLLGRKCPELPAEIIFSKYELLTMSLIEKKRSKIFPRQLAL